MVGGAQAKERRAPPRHGRYVIWLRDPSMLHRRALWSWAARRRQRVLVRKRQDATS